MFNQAYAGTLPLQGSELAASWDTLYHFLVGVSIFFFALVVGAMIYFVFKFKHRPGVKSKYITGSHLLEALWTLIPTVLLLGIFGWGYVVYNQMTRTPTDAYEVRVIAKQWLWQFQYDDGRTTVGEVFVPMGRPVKMIMTSEDVIHSFFVPNFRIKQDVVPGMYTSVWFEATVPGKHQIFCTEYCGTSHSEMLAKLTVLEPEQWEQWRKGKKIGDIPVAGIGGVTLTSANAPKAPEGLAGQGEKVAQMKGCFACHSTDGSAKIGPTWKGLFGRQEELADGSKVSADENYIRESIEQPQAKIVKGYSNVVMPTFKGLINETEMNALMAYLKSLK